jgi:hypothetical protein
MPNVMVMLSLSPEIANKLAEITVPANGKSGTGLAGVIKKILHKSLGVPLEDYHAKKVRGERGAYKKKKATETTPEATNTTEDFDFTA